jgi:hypothetical protein
LLFCFSANSKEERLSQNFSFWETSFACPATLKFAVLQGGCKAKSRKATGLKNCKSLQAQDTGKIKAAKAGVCAVFGLKPGVNSS